jgi:flagellar biosynthesis protein FlhB
MPYDSNNTLIYLLKILFLITVFSLATWQVFWDFIPQLTDKYEKDKRLKSGDWFKFFLTIMYFICTFYIILGIIIYMIKNQN